jgi:hypothetical protein
MKTLGPELGLLYNALYNKRVLLHVKWRQYLELFGTKPERLDLLNRSAPGFFRIVQDTFLDDAFLHLSRSTEKPNFRQEEKLLRSGACRRLYRIRSFSLRSYRSVQVGRPYFRVSTSSRSPTIATHSNRWKPTRTFTFHAKRRNRRFTGTFLSQWKDFLFVAIILFVFQKRTSQNI